MYRVSTTLQELRTNQFIGHINIGKTNANLCAISGFRREGDENCVVLDFYALSSGNFLPKFRDNFPVSSSRVKILAIKNETENLYRNVGKKLPLLAA
jgi:hypothetical protein